MMGPTMRSILSVLVILTYICASGCIPSYNRIESTSESIHESIEPGHVVKVRTLDRRKLKFKVVEVNSQSVIGNGEHVDIDDIVIIEKKQKKSGFYYFLKGLEAMASLPF